VNDLARAIVIAALILGGAAVVRGTFGTDRYDLVPAPAGSVYRLDRLTGAVTFCTPAFCRPLATLVPKAQAPGPQPSPESPGSPAQPGPTT
jgi:hypothetical protein